MLIIGIAGGTGSGKTTVVQQIVEQLSQKDIKVLSQDSYYNTTDHLSSIERTKINFDHPNAIDFDLLVAHLIHLKKGNSIDQPIYSFVEHNRTESSLKMEPPKVLIIEGILIFNHKALRNLCDIKIYIDADADERLIRRVKRDIQDRGRDLHEILNRYQETLKPMHNQYIEPTKQFADIIMPNDRLNLVAIDVIKTIINEKFN